MSKFQILRSVPTRSRSALLAPSIVIAVAAMLGFKYSAGAATLIDANTRNGSFELPGDNGLDAGQKGFDPANDVPFWQNTTTTYNDSGVRNNGHGGFLGATNGTHAAQIVNGDGGAFQTTGYSILSGDQFTFNIQAGVGYTATGSPNTLQLSLLAFSPSATGSGATLFAQATSIAVQSFTLTSSYATYTLSYTATAADAGKILGVAFSNTSTGQFSYDDYDSVNVSVTPAAAASDSLVWTGAKNSNWSTTPQGTPYNWHSNTSNTDTEFTTDAAVLFNDTSSNGTVLISDANVSTTGVTFNNSTTVYTISSAGGFGITGTGSLVKNGTASVTIATANTYTGSTSVTAGTLNLTGSLAGSNVSTSGTGAFLQSSTGVISGSGTTFTQGSNGTSILRGTNTYTGATTISAGTLQLGDGTSGNDGTVATNITNNANLVFNRFGSSSYGGVISGSGTVVKSGAGTQTLSGANTFTGNVTINSGTLVANNGNNTSSTRTESALGNATVAHTVTINNGGTLSFTAGNSFGNVGTSNVISYVVNAGGLIQNNVADLNTLGPVTLNGGRIDGANGYNTDFRSFSLRGDVTVTGNTTSILSSTGGNSGFMLSGQATRTVTFNVGDGAAATDLLVSGVLDNGYNISGSASKAASNLNKVGAGTMALTGANLYTGTTTITGGTLLLGAANTLKTGTTDSTRTAVALAGGTLSTGGFSQGAAGSTLGALTLASTSTLTLGTVAGSETIAFSDLATNLANFTGSLTINNWDGTLGTSAGGDNVFFATNTGFSTGVAYNNIQFNIGGIFYSTQFEAVNGGFEAYAIAPVPEPSTWIGAGLITGLAGWSQRRRLFKRSGLAIVA